MSKVMSRLAYLLLSTVLTVACAQAPGDEDKLCTNILPSLGQNMFAGPPNVVPLMDSSHYVFLLPPNLNPVWQSLDLDDNNPRGQETSVRV